MEYKPEHGPMQYHYFHPAYFILSIQVELEADSEVVVEAVPHFEFLPTELLCRIFNYLELKERGIAERVCSRWHSVLTSRDCPLADVVVVNLFEPSVWVDTIAKNRYTTVKGTFVNDFDGLRNVFHHISSAHTAKLWFHTEGFARKCIDVIAEFLEVRCVDVYPYANVHILPYLQKKLPHLSALNMRPHSNQFHACGLQLPSFPEFSKLTTLILDNYGVEADFELPKTVTSLDYSKREQTHYRALLPKLLHLINLEYFTLSHADMSRPEDFNAFVRTVSNENLPKLTILTLRMCKICALNLQDEQIAMNLKMIKSPFLDLKPPTSLFYVLTKFEASFVEDIVLFRTLLMSGTFKVLRECKFVECDALTSEVLQHISESAPTLRKIGVLSCTKPKDTDVIMFIASISARTTPHLQITWRRDRRIGSLAACYLALVHEHREMIKGKKARFFAKTFSESEEGEEIVIWERDTGKSVQIRDYNDHQKYRTLGFIIGAEPVRDDAPAAVMDELMSKLECS
ncbi:hypothetical protein ANCCEY_01239 [Ancylostoma ceylanicum]|uniref:F-box domain-containing protein n=1 Tax=Ancylostoma ceylanicum TaxID=53326 RepID=A0A0D6M6E4_9BILA|nr:hypothetical protein ANCCEY_01239 [Ancylostoma ceylanicum]